MDKQEKDLIQSRTFWGIVIALGSTAASYAGVHIDQQVWVTYALTGAGVGFAMYGRYKAHLPITSAFFLTTVSAAAKRAAAAQAAAAAADATSETPSA